jgi:hypothetical protein
MRSIIGFDTFRDKRPAGIEVEFPKDFPSVNSLQIFG